MRSFETVYIDMDIYNKLKQQAEKTGQTLNGLLKGFTEVIDLFDEAAEEMGGDSDA